MSGLKTFYHLFLVGVIAILAISCNSDKKDNEAAKEEVIRIHDEVMPLMGELKTKQKELIARAESLHSEDSVGFQEEILALRTVAKELDKAYEGMFVWMRQFKVDYEEMNDQEVADYLGKQKQEVTKVNENIKSALEKSEKLLD